MSTLKIEAGKHYRTKSGFRARIYATDGYGRTPIHGAILYVNGWQAERWCEDGHYLASLGDEHDLIAEWREPQVDWSKMPAWAMWVARDEDGKVHWFKDQPTKMISTWMGTTYLYGFVPPEYVLHREGDWSESLEQRPEEAKP